MNDIRPFAYTDSEYAEVIRIGNLIYIDEPKTVDELRHRDRSWNKDYFFARYLLLADGAIAGFGAMYTPYWSYAPGKYTITIDVEPAMQGRGLGRLFYEFAMAELGARAEPPTLLQTYARSDQPRGIRFLEDRGFAQVMRWWTSALDLEAFDPAAYDALFASVAGDGIELVTAADYARRDPAWQQKIYALDQEAAQDEPQPGDYTPLPFEEYAKMAFKKPNFRAEQLFLAVDGDRVVGLSELPHNPSDPRTLFTGFTGVARSHRRRGLATALKARSLCWAKAAGVTNVLTGNEEHNPMFEINRNVGFEPTIAVMAYEKRAVVDK